MKPYKIIVSDGLLWHNEVGPRENIIGCQEGDRIAQANNMVYVEHVVKAYPAGTVLTLDHELKIIYGHCP